jgi:hypothetical protein
MQHDWIIIDGREIEYRYITADECRIVSIDGRKVTGEIDAELEQRVLDAHNAGIGHDNWKD